MPKNNAQSQPSDNFHLVPSIFDCSSCNFLNGERAQIISQPISYSASFDCVHRKLISIIAEDYSKKEQLTCCEVIANAQLK